MSKIQVQSRRVRILFQCIFFLVPIVVGYYWMTVGTEYDFISASGAIQMSYNFDEFTQQPLNATTRLLMVFISLLLCSIPMYALNILTQLFRNYERNDVFSLENVQCYQKLGYSLFSWVGGSIVYSALSSVILSFNNPPGKRILQISFEGMDFLALVLGFIILIISWVMKEGYMLADENSHTI